LKITFFYIIIPALFFLSLLTYRAQGQLSTGGTPVSIQYGLNGVNRDLIVLTPPDLIAITNADNLEPSPYRFAVNLPAEITPDKSGYWMDVPGGGKIWRAAIYAKGALALTAYFDRFRIPSGGRLFLYNADQTDIIGAFTEMNNSASGIFATGLIPGDRLTLEYDQPAGIKEMPVIHVNEIAWAYRGVDFFEGKSPNQGSAGQCEVNVICPEGNAWQKQIRGVVRIQVKKAASSYWCSGSVVNNTRNDGTPYVLTADHCGANATPEDIGKWIFYFNYEAAVCTNPPDPGTPLSITGAVMKAHGGNSGNTGSDFFLVRLDQNIPGSFNVYFNGWSRTDSASPSGVGIHHPEGDVKKISTYDQPLITSNWQGGPYLSHWKVKWIQTVNGHGVTEGGSSGSPIFDNQGHIVGALTGGDSNCDSASLDLPDYYGKFSWSWDKNGSDSVSVLKYWLDPDSTGLKILDGIGVGINEINSSLPVKVFPNPFTEKVTIELSHFTGDGSLMIRDLSGRLLLFQQIPGSHGQSVSLGLAELADGLYFLEIMGSKRISVIKIIKQKP